MFPWGILRRVKKPTWLQNQCINPAVIYLLKVNNNNTRTMSEICSKLAIKTPHFSPCSGVSIVEFDQANAGWG